MKIFNLLFISFLLFSCSSQKEQKTEETTPSNVLKIAGSTADFLQMTQDAQGNIVAWWVEENTQSKEAMVHFSKASGSDFEFTENQSIPTTRNLNPGGGESIPKLIIKPDGTYILVYTKRHKDSEAMFASGVYYTQSFDEGRSWSEARMIHSDENRDNGHGFPEAILLPDGEVAAVWLDGRHHLDHSAMYFAKTNGKNGFGKDKIIGGPSCQCCKIDMYVDDENILHVAYRGIMGDNIRDIQHITSSDNGGSFSDTELVSDDNWQINGCPHNGPSISKSKDKLHALWFTAGGESGVYHSVSEDNGQTFSPRQKLTDYAKHLYIASAGNSALALWEESFQGNEKSYTRVKMSMFTSTNGAKIKSEYLSPVGVRAAMPYLLEQNNGNTLAMWTQYGEKENQIYYRVFTNSEFIAER